jgi:chromosome segregation ATPase
MARTGVSYTEVAEAAMQLTGQGRNPTVEQVRILLGTGSSTTIANHLRQWKANQEASSLISSKENIPTELVSVMKGLWERVNSYSNEKITAIEMNYNQEVAELRREVDKYKTNNQRWQKMFNQWQQEKSQLANDKLSLEQALEFTHKENMSLNAKQDALQQQLQDKQDRVDELNRLHKQAQANLEHYRESAREQRTLDQHQFEQQKQLLQAEVKMLNEQMVAQRGQSLVLQNQYQALMQSHSSLEKIHDQVQLQLEQVKSKLEVSEISKQENLSMSQHWQNQYNVSQKLLDDKTNQFIEVQAETKLLSQQLGQVNLSLKQLQDQNKLLSLEKWEFAQEKSHLEGRLRQMQESIVA